jgi:hypothetical protein
MKARVALRALGVTTLLFAAVAVNTAGALAARAPAKAPKGAAKAAAADFEIAGAVEPAAASDLAVAMNVPPLDIVSADVMGSDAASAGTSDSLGASFPTKGDDFAILSTGLAADASAPDDSGSRTSVLGGLNNVQGNDLSRLHLRLNVPVGIDCMNFDLAFYSEEFPEFVGSQYNDAFTAQNGVSTLDVANNAVVAPTNFALDTVGNVVSVNTVYGVTGGTGTTYDGATPLLRASSNVVGGTTVDLYLSIQDLGDSFWDSAVFLDNFYWSAGTACNSGAAVDSDGDGLLDTWERDGLEVSGDFVNLPAMGANPQRKDLFVEADWMGPASAGAHSHKPSAVAIALIGESFSNAPVSNPDGSTGITLHVDYGSDAPIAWGNPTTFGALSHADQLTHQDNLGTGGNPYSWTAFQAIKDVRLTAGRLAVFHYNIWAHNLSTELGGTSGISRDISASDFIVSLGSWTGGTGTTNEQAGTFMHEFGHNLGLKHGGTDHTQWKPNYLSVMGYAFQTRGVIVGGTEGHFDYSRAALATKVESALDETIGIGTTRGTRWFCALDDQRVDLDGSSVDWNCDGDAADNPVSRNINRGMSWNNNTTLDTLTGFDDWANIVYTGGAIGAPGALIPLPSTTFPEEITEVQDDAIASPYRAQLRALREQLAALPLTGQADLRRDNAVAFLVRADAESGWADNETPATNSAGRNVFVLIRQSVQYQRSPNEVLAAASAGIQTALIDLAGAMAQARYDEVVATPGASTSRLAQARENLDAAALVPQTIDALYHYVAAWSALQSEPPQNT